jgi:hypothetical protein
MSEVTPIVDDQEMLRAYAEIERLKVFESRYREEYEIVKRIWEIIGFDEYNSKGSPEKSIFDYIQGYKRLLTRAADRIYMWVDAGLDPSLETKELIAELREAAQ